MIPRIDMIKDLLAKIDHASEMASRSDLKVVELLEKQTRLQEESINNEREFLNVFKSIASQMSTH